jgi:hypothetical protein
MKRTLESDIRDYFCALTEHVESATTAERRLPRVRRSGRFIGALSLSALVAFAIFLTVVLTSRTTPTENVETSPGSNGDLGSPVTPPAWVTLDASSLAQPEGSSFAVWTGTEVVVIFAENAGSDVGVIGARLDLATGQSHPISPSPLGWRANAGIAWTGEELVIVGGSSGPGIRIAGAAYSPDTDSWRIVSPPPNFEAGESSSQISGPAIWTGGEVIYWRSALAYTPSTDTWRSLPPSPLGVRSYAAVVPTDRGLVVWGGCSGLDCPVDSASWLPDGAIYDSASDLWTMLPPSPLAAAPAALGAIADQALTLVTLASDAGGGGEAARLDLERSDWTLLPAPPTTPSLGASLTVTGVDLVVIGGQQSGAVMAFSQETDTWRTLASLPEQRWFHSTAWSGESLVIAGGFPTGVPLVSSGPFLSQG